MIAMTSPSRRAFTLIELLVVISIIALLVAILLPALRSAREAARGMQCLSHQRQMLIGIVNYTQDFDGWMPPGNHRYPQPITAHGATRTNAVIPWYSSYHAGRYFGNTNIIATAWPESRQAPSIDIVNCPEKTDPNRHPHDIGIGYNNSPHNFFTLPPGHRDLRPYHQFRAPSRLFVLMDVEVGLLWRQFAIGGPVGKPVEDTDAGPDKGVTAYRHNESTTVGFADGHASLVRDALAAYDAGELTPNAAR